MGLPQSEPYARDAFWAAILEFTNIDAAGLAKILAPNSGVKWRQWTGQRDEWLAWMYGKMLYVVEKIARQEGWHVDLDSLISNKPILFMHQMTETLRFYNGSPSLNTPARFSSVQASVATIIGDN